MIKSIQLLILFFYSIHFSFAQTKDLNIPTNGLIGYWPFNGNANDESGNGNNGSVFGANLSSDRFGLSERAYFFNGLDNWIVIPNTSKVDFKSGLTFSAWVFINKFSNSSIVDKISNSKKGFRICTRSAEIGPEIPIGTLESPPRIKMGPLLSSRIWSCSGTLQYGTGIAISDNPYSLNTWILITGVYNTEENCTKLYINNQIVDSTFSSNNAYIDEDESNIYIGRRTNGLFELFNGKIDDIAIWNRPLTTDEIIHLYNKNETKSPSTRINSGVSVAQPENKNEQVKSQETSTISNPAVCDKLMLRRPSLNFLIVDDRELCKCCNEKYAIYELSNSIESDKKLEEVFYLNAILRKHLLEVDHAHADIDKRRFDSYIINNYGFTQDYLRSIQKTLQMLIDTYGEEKVNPLNKTRKISKYKGVSKYCSLRCQNDPRCN